MITRLELGPRESRDLHAHLWRHRGRVPRPPDAASAYTAKWCSADLRRCRRMHMQVQVHGLRGLRHVSRVGLAAHGHVAAGASPPRRGYCRNAGPASAQRKTRQQRINVAARSAAMQAFAAAEGICKCTGCARVATRRGPVAGRGRGAAARRARHCRNATRGQQAHHAKHGSSASRWQCAALQCRPSPLQEDAYASARCAHGMRRVCRRTRPRGRRARHSPNARRGRQAHHATHGSSAST